MSPELFWALLFIVGGGYELRAVLNKRKGDTLSEQVWKLNRLASPILWITTAFMVWLTGHFAGCPFIEADAFRTLFCG